MPASLCVCIVHQSASEMRMVQLMPLHRGLPFYSKHDCTQKQTIKQVSDVAKSVHLLKIKHHKFTAACMKQGNTIVIPRKCFLMSDK